MLLAVFLTHFISRLDKKNISHCVLRNYESLPESNIGNDIDFLVLPTDVEATINVLFDIKEVAITGYIKRSYVVSLFVYGVEWGAGLNAIQIDLVTSLSWKGLPYLSSENVLNNLIEVPDSDGLIKRPADHYEAVNSLFSSYLVGGWIKDKYQLSIKSTFNDQYDDVLLLLHEIMTEKKAKQFIDHVLNDEIDKLLALLPRIKLRMLRKSFLANPMKTLYGILIYYYYEIKIRFTPHPIDSICFLGPDGAGKSTLIKLIIENLQGATKGFSCLHLKPAMKKNVSSTPVLVENPHAKKPRSAIISIGKICFWGLLYWKNQFFHGYKNLTLRIWDRYFYDVYIDPKRYRFGAPLWIAKLIGKFIPQPELIIVLDAPAETIYERKQEVTFEELNRQRLAYLEFSKNQENSIVLKTDMGIEETVKNGCMEIVGFMRKKQLKRRVL